MNFRLEPVQVGVRPSRFPFPLELGSNGRIPHEAIPSSWILRGCDENFPPTPTSAA